MKDVNEFPAVGAPGAPPNINALIQGYKSCSPWNNGWNRIQSNDDVRFNRWANQTPDCKKRGTPDKPAFPWQDASDQACFLADDVVNGIVAECCEAFWRSWFSPKAGASMISNYAVKLADYCVNTWLREELMVEVELSEQYRQTYGWVALYPTWEREVAFENRMVHLADLVAAAQELAQRLQGPEGEQILEAMPLAEQLVNLPGLIADPEREEEVIAIFQEVYVQWGARKVSGIELPPLPGARLRKVVRSLRATAEAELPVPYVCRDEPAIYALKPWEEIFVPRTCTDVSKSPVFRVDWLSEVDLRAKIREEDWDKGWVEEALKHKGKFSSWSAARGHQGGEPPSSLRSAMGQTDWEQQDSEVHELVEVVYATYPMVDSQNIRGIYLTVFHAAVGASSGAPAPGAAYAWHGLLRDAKAKAPYIIGKREWLARTVTSSRGVPEICNSWQRQEKIQTDGTMDWTSIGVLPPVNVYATALKTQYTFGPAVRNFVLPGREPKFMEVPSKGMPVAFEILDRIEKKVARYFGQEHPELAPGDAVRRRQKTVGFFLLMWAESIQRVVEMCQKNMKDDHFAEVTGAPIGWLDQNRNEDGLLAARLEFDIRELDPEYVANILKAINETVIPQDVNGLTNRARWTRTQWRMISPRLARELVTEEGDASKQILDAVRRDIQGMFLGDEADYVEMDPSAKAKMQYAQQIIEANPNYTQALQNGGRFGELLQKYFKNLQHSVTQEGNKMVGRIGVQGEALHSPGAEGAPGGGGGSSYGGAM